MSEPTSREQSSAPEAAPADDILLASKLNKSKVLVENDEDYEPIDASPVDYKTSTEEEKKIKPQPEVVIRSSAPSYYDHAFKKRRIVKKTFKPSSRRRDDDDSADVAEDTNNTGEKEQQESDYSQSKSDSIEPQVADELTQVITKTKETSVPEKLLPHKSSHTQRQYNNPLPPSQVNSHKPSWMPEEVFQQQQAALQKAFESTEYGNQARRDYNNDEYHLSDQRYNNNHHSHSTNGHYGNNMDHYRSESPRNSPSPSQLMNLDQAQKDEIIRNKYNQQTFHSRRQKRTESKIYKLRSFNNCIKYILINKYGKQEGNVLDLGCGKGGDMAKWDSIGTSSYVGVDLSDQSISEAIKRYKKSRFQFHAIFATGDAFNVPVPKLLENFKDEVNLEFDTVSMQFCLHYAFDSEETMRHLLENISRSLKIGGMFIGTIPSSDFINWKLKKLAPGEKKWGNSIYSVEFPTEPPKDGRFENPFGNIYNYYLVDAVDNVPEFVVPFEKFRSLCENYNLELRYKKNFFELFNKEIPTYFKNLPSPLIESLRKPDGSYGVTGEDRDACSFYLAFGFEKTGY